MLNPYAVEPGVCCHQQCPRLHLCFATACYQTAGRSISRGRIHGIFGFHAASSHINYLQECAAFHLLSTSYQVCSGVTLLRGLVVLAGHHPLGILGKCRRDGVGLSRLEKQEIVLWAYFMERIVYIEFPGHPVKQAGVSL